MSHVVIWTAWKAWLAPAQVPDADHELLSDSGAFRFQSVDSKLSIALQNLVENAGEMAYEIKVRIDRGAKRLERRGVS